jgi:pyridoxal phosphate enzyme (YggS family)
MLTRSEFVKRFPEAVLVAISKRRPIDAIERLYREGQRDFGENYVQELLEKAEQAKARGLDQIRWHLVGHLQSNKVKKVVPIVHAIHSIDSFELAKRCSDLAEGRTVDVFVQVNVDGEETKSGIEPEEVPDLCERIKKLAGVRLLGLMALPRPNRPENEIQQSFETVAALGARCRAWTQGKLSLGTTDDFEIALQVGATHVRLGRALFDELQESARGSVLEPSGDS